MCRDMRKLIVVALALIGATFFSIAPAMAQATRTWISGVGDDANPCSRTAPCKTWAGAISKTAAGGEIDALDPGGFGALTITKSITLDGGGGQVASVLVAGTNGIVVAAQPTDVVILRNLRFDGLLGNGSSPGSAGTNGISFISGATLNIERCYIFGFNASGINAGVSASSQLNVTDTVIENAPTGINLTSSSGTLVGSINRVTIQTTSVVGVASNTGAGFVIFNITNSLITSANTGVNAATATTRFNVDTSTIANSNTALNASASGAIIRAANNALLDNSTNFAIAGGATIASTGNNRIGGGGGVAPNATYTQQ